MKVLIVGGYGTFGGRLARLLADEAGVSLLIAGRSLHKATDFCDTHLAGADAQPVVFDREGDIDQALAALTPDLVVDASGPFQDYQGDVFRLVRACLTAGCHYIDLADAADFVTGIQQFDQAARDKGCFVLSGASSFPTLSAAAVQRLAREMVRVETITAGIAPSPYAQLSDSVLRAGISYAGKPIALIHNGQPVTGYGLAEGRRSTIAPPGRLPLANRLFSLVDVLDVQLLPAMWPDLKSVWLGFASAPDLPQRVLYLLAAPVRWGVLPSLRFLTPIIIRAAKLLRWGEDRSGMFVAVAGRGADGKLTERSWHLIAQDDHGPFVPAMAVAAVVRHGLAGNWPEPGARPATGDVSLEDYEDLFARFSMRSGVRDAGPTTAVLPLYQRVLGSAWEELPAPVRSMHDFEETMVAEGRASVGRGKGLLSRLASMIFGFPPAGDDVAVSVRFSEEAGRETWQRTFGGRSFKSFQYQGRGRSAYLLTERFGPVAVGLALVVQDQQLHLVVRRWSLFGLAMPLFLAPHSRAYESAEDGRFHFHVEIGHPLTGMIVTYRGWLEPRTLTAQEEAAIARSKTAFARSSE